MSDDQPRPEAPAEMTSNIEISRCPSCGQPVLPESRFCSACGAALTAGDTATLPNPDDTGPVPAVDAEVLRGLTPGDAVLVISRGPDEGVTFELTGDTVSIGRGDDSTVFLDDVTVSRRHAELAHVEEGWVLSDAGSLNGSYVNKKSVVTQALANGDEIQIGKYRFLFLEAPST